MSETSAEYFTFNVDNSALVVGQTGSGKSHLAHAVIDRFKSALSPEQLELVLFDLKRIEYQDEPEDYLRKPVIVDSEEGLDVLDDLAQLAVKRAEDDTEHPLLLIYIEECDMAMLNQQRFDAAVITINTHAKAANIKLMYSTSRPSPDVISEKLMQSFDLILAGELASEADATYLGVPQHPNERFAFSVKEQGKQKSGTSQKLPAADGPIDTIFEYAREVTPKNGGFDDYWDLVDFEQWVYKIYKETGALPDTLEDLHKALLMCAERNKISSSFIDGDPNQPYPRAIMTKIISLL